MILQIFGLDFSRDRVEWMLPYQGMVVLAGNQIWWTWEVEDVFSKVCWNFLLLRT